MKKTSLIIILVLTATIGSAQINPSPSQFFYNKLFQNVAATGMDKGLHLDAVYRNMTPNTFVGSPVNTLVSLQGATGSSSGLGVQFQNERAGLLSRSRMMGSYALDLSKGTTRIRLGVGIGTMMTRLNPGGAVMVRGDVNDPMIAAFNNQKARIDGSVGMMLTTEKGWELMASLPSLGSVQEFKGYNAIDYVVANAMVSRKFSIAKDEEGEVLLQPMLGYRVINGVADVMDMGALMSYKNWIRFLGMYHSNNEFALGVGIPYKNKLSFDFTYNTGKVYSKDYFNVGGTIEAHVMYKF